ncbi:MAG: hypothetical protein LBQ24_07115 [Candidatus Peribacteria bacterium]|nr:hypothetical protein [Candidatus Peribacteria bacterium]
MNVQNEGGDEYNFSLRNNTDLSAIEVLNGFRSGVQIQPNSAFATYTVN